MEKEELDELRDAVRTLYLYCCKTMCSKCKFEQVCNMPKPSLYGMVRDLKYRIEDEYDKMGVI